MRVRRSRTGTGVVPARAITLLGMGFFKKLFGGGERKLDRRDIGSVVVDGEPALVTEDVHTITGRGYVLFGELLRDVAVENVVRLHGKDGRPLPDVDVTRITRISVGNEEVFHASEGQEAAILVATPRPLLDVLP